MTEINESAKYPIGAVLTSEDVDVLRYPQYEQPSGMGYMGALEWTHEYRARYNTVVAKLRAIFPHEHTYPERWDVANVSRPASPPYDAQTGHLVMTAPVMTWSRSCVWCGHRVETTDRPTT